MDLAEHDSLIIQVKVLPSIDQYLISLGNNPSQNVTAEAEKLCLAP